jgi:hypothetical protein
MFKHEKYAKNLVGVLACAA